MLKSKRIHRHSLLAFVPASFPVFNLLGDKTKAAADWKARFENRKPPTEPRAAKSVTVRAAAGNDTTDILLYDEIGYWGITDKEFVTALATVTTPNIRVRINSPGGDVFAGMTIYNALLGWKGDVDCVIEGVAASAASFIAMAGDTISIHETAMIMVHRAWGYAMGNTKAMADMANTLSKIDGQIAGIYAKQTGKKVDEMLAIMDGTSDGTWFTSDEAKAAGFVGEVIAPDTEEEQNPVAPETPDPMQDPDGDDPDMKAMLGKLAMMRRRLALADAE